MADDPTEARPATGAFAELIRGLAEDRHLYNLAAKAAHAQQPNAAPAQQLKAVARFRRQFATSALRHVVRFLNDSETLNRCPDILRWGLDVHLRELLEALLELEDGRAPEMLRAKPGKGSSRVESAFKGKVAAMAEMLRRAGEAPKQADDKMAKELREAGYKTPRADGSITGPTVRAWRKEARERAADDPLRVEYEQIIRIWAPPGAEPNDLRRAAGRLMADLAARQPAAGLRKLPLVGDSPPEK
jgi:hypothetical protein